MKPVFKSVAPQKTQINGTTKFRKTPFRRFVNENTSWPPKRQRIISSSSSINTFWLSSAIQYCPMCDFSTEGQMLGHITKKHNHQMKKPDSAKALVTIQTHLSNKGTKLIRMSDIKKAVGTEWKSAQSRMTAYKLCLLGQMVPWKGQWNLQGISDPVDRLSEHIIFDKYEEFENDNLIGYSSSLLRKRSKNQTKNAQPISTSDIQTVSSESELDEVDEFSFHNERTLTSDQRPPTGKDLLSALKNNNLQNQLSKNHPLLRMFKEVLKITHPTQDNVVKNYTALISRVFCFVTREMAKTTTPSKHWSDLLQKPDLIIKYLEIQIACGSSPSTTISYLKQIRSLYEMATTSFPFLDDTFPKNETLDSYPETIVINRMTIAMNQLTNYYHEAEKLAYQNAIDNSTADAIEVVQMSNLKELIDNMKLKLFDKFDKLEVEFYKVFGNLDMSIKFVNGTKTNTLSKLWRKSVTSLCSVIMFETKIRSGVLQNITLKEFESSHRASGKERIIWMTKYIFGLSRPVVIVLDHSLTAIIDRYYVLRKRLNYPIINFFVSITGQKITKIFDNLNATIKKRNIRYTNIVNGTPGELVQVSCTQFRKQIKMAADLHDAETRALCAYAMQYSESERVSHRRIETEEEAIRNYQTIKKVENSCLLAEYLITNLSHVLEIHEDFRVPTFDDFLKIIYERHILQMFPGSVLTKSAFDDIIQRVLLMIQNDRAEMLKKKARLYGYSEYTFGETQLTQIASKMDKNHWVSDARSRNRLVEKIKCLLK